VNGVRAGLDEWARGNAKDEGNRFSPNVEGNKGRIAEWMALFMRTGFRLDVVATSIERETKEQCYIKSANKYYYK
jgi:hypothetical protein